MSPTTADQLHRTYAGLRTKMYRRPKPLTTFAGGQVLVNREVTIDLTFRTPGGPLVLQNVRCWVTDAPLPSSLGDILLSREITHRLGYSPRRLIEQAWLDSPVFDCASDYVTASQRLYRPMNLRDCYYQLPLCTAMNEPQPRSRGPKRVTSELGDIDGPAVAVASVGATPAEMRPPPEEVRWVDDEALVCFPDMDGRSVSEEELEVKKVIEAGLPKEGALELLALLDEFVDVSRLRLGRDPPVDMPALEVRLKPNAEPVR